MIQVTLRLVKHWFQNDESNQIEKLKHAMLASHLLLRQIPLYAKITSTILLTSNTIDYKQAWKILNEADRVGIIIGDKASATIAKMQNQQPRSKLRGYAQSTIKNFAPRGGELDPRVGLQEEARYAEQY